MFGTVPKVLWEKTNPTDEHNRIEMEARTLFLDGGPGGRRILIDCGIGGDFIAKYGQKLGAKFAEMYSVKSQGAVEKYLNSLGLSLGDITDVILTHLHFDHAGGATCARLDQLVPTFPNAKYYIQKANLETARHPNIREKASYFSPNFEPLAQAGVLEILDGPIENFLPGISAIVSHGHTTGQQIIKISDEKTTLVYCADLIPTSTHIRLAWIMGYDLRPLEIIEEKRQLLEKAAAHGWYLYFEHDPYVDAARVAAEKGDFTVLERLRLA